LRLGEARRKLGSIGQLLPYLEARLVDEKGKDVADGLAGELLLKGPTMMKYVIYTLVKLYSSYQTPFDLNRGYWRNQEATRDSFTEDGWLKTGDVAKVDVEGYW
jgi:long-subunit acyl-CoA synthetase (AMP-forming)